MIARAGGSLGNSGGANSKSKQSKQKQKPNEENEEEKKNLNNGSETDVELVGSNPTERNWRGILIALLVILIVLSLIVVAVILVTPKDDKVDPGEPFTFEDFLGSEYKPRHFGAQWIGEKPIYVFRSREAEVIEYNVEENRTETIMDNSTFRELNSDVYYVSEDLKYVLIAYDIEQIYRHSFLAKYAIYSRYAKNTNEKLIPFPQPTSPDDDWKQKKLQFAGWSKTGKGLTFVYNNDLYYQADPFTTYTQVTTTGSQGLIYNGIADWLYEEEILHTSVAHWMSTDGAHIVYAKFDDTNVPKYRFPFYGPPNNIYDTWNEVAYPKAGDRDTGINPVVTLWMLDTANPRSAHKQLEAPKDKLGQVDYYLTSVVWQDKDHVLVVWSNRPQNRSLVMLCEAQMGECKENMDESTHGRGWLAMPTPRFVENGNTYLTILPNRDGHFGYWKHIAMVTAKFGRKGTRSFVTQGLWDVTDIVGYRISAVASYVYYIGTNGDPKTRHLFEVEIPDGSNMLKRPYCMTCDYPLSCQWFSATFSANGEYYILHCLGPGLPKSMLKSTIDTREIVVEDNAELRVRLEKKAQPIKEYINIDIGNGEEMLAQVMLPPTLNKDHITKYPVLINTYGGPGTQRVTEQFHIGFETYLTTTENVIYVVIDGRGSGGRGDAWLHSIYRALGTAEVQDQVTGAKYVRDTFHFVDEERVAIWGWSYGGFVTAHALGHPENDDIITCGISVAPVTDFRYYDTAYTERYMGLANSEDNYKGYDRANVATRADNFRGKKFMIVHGTADDNVHFQHSAQLTKALTEAEVEYRSQVYSDQSHALSGPKTSRHLYRTIMSFLKKECWNGGKPKLEGKPETKEA